MIKKSIITRFPNADKHLTVRLYGSYNATLPTKYCHVFVTSTDLLPFFLSSHSPSPHSAANALKPLEGLSVERATACPLSLPRRCPSVCFPIDCSFLPRARSRDTPPFVVEPTAAESDIERFPPPLHLPLPPLPPLTDLVPLHLPPSTKFASIQYNITLWKSPPQDCNKHISPTATIFLLLQVIDIACPTNRLRSSQ